MNGSGLIVFNEEDYKNLISMSPKNKSGRVNFRTNGLDCEFHDIQHTNRCMPIVKDMPQLESLHQKGMRLRSISHQNDQQAFSDKKKLYEVVKKTKYVNKKKLMQYMNESGGSLNDREEDFDVKFQKTPEIIKDETLSPEQIVRRDLDLDDIKLEVS